MNPCRSCGARQPLEAEWCWQCYLPLTKPEPATQDVEVLPPARYSRWKASVTTFGPTGKIVITSVLVAFGLLMFLLLKTVEGPLVFADISIYAIGAGFLLRHVWRRVRVS
jgi:hypothetical protein